VVLGAALYGGGSASVEATAGATAAGGKPDCPRAAAGRHDLGRVAFIDGDRLRVVRLASCRVQTLVDSGVTPPLRWSADGRYLAYGSGEVVSASGGTPAQPLGPLQRGWGSGSPGWVWSPRGHRLAGVTAHGGVAVGGPGEQARQLWPQRWGANSIAWAPDGRTLAVSRSLYPRPPFHQEIWLLNLATDRPRLLWHLGESDLAPAWLSGFSPDGRWLLTWQTHRTRPRSLPTASRSR